jgi:hypothetical protein
MLIALLIGLALLALSLPTSLIVARCLAWARDEAAEGRVGGAPAAAVLPRNGDNQPLGGRRTWQRGEPLDANGDGSVAWRDTKTTRAAPEPTHAESRFAEISANLASSPSSSTMYGFQPGKRAI